MNFLRKLFLPVVALVVLLNVFSINTLSAKAVEPEIESTYSQPSGDDIVPAIDGTFSQEDGGTVLPRSIQMNLIVAWKHYANYAATPAIEYDYDQRFKLYKTAGNFTQKDSSSLISSAWEHGLGRYTWQYYRTYEFY